MTHRSHYHTFVRTVLAALAVVVGATLVAPVGAPPVLVALEYTPRAAIVTALSTVSVASAFRAAPLQSEVTESSSLAPHDSPTETVHPVRSTAPMPSHWARTEPTPGTSIEAVSCEAALLFSALAGTAQDPQDPETPDEDSPCEVGTPDTCIDCKSESSTITAIVEDGVATIEYCVTNAECTIKGRGGVTISFKTEGECFDIIIEPEEDGEGT